MRLKHVKFHSLGVLILLACSFGCSRGENSLNATNDPTKIGLEITSKPTSFRAADRNVSFLEVTQDSKINHIYKNGEDSDQYAYVEMVGGGVGVFDYDLDGKVDIVFSGGGVITENAPLTGHPATLWRGNGPWEYQNTAANAGLDDTDIYTHGVAIADFNSDGFPDLVITGFGGLHFFQNCGDGTFISCAKQIGLNTDTWTSSAGWGDLDNDGHPDLFLTNYVNWSWQNNPICPGPPPANRDVCAPQAFDGLKDMVFWNNGDGTFTKAGEEIGLENAGKGLGNILVDFDHDSKIDVYVANDTNNNFLYMNAGKRRLRESGIVSGTALDHLGIPNGSMGLAVFDYDNDLLPDLLVTNYERETIAIYRNGGNGNFRCISERTGITALGSLFVGFGVTAGDFNCDGREDLVIANGHVMRHTESNSSKQAPLFISNIGSDRLGRLTFELPSYFAERHIGRGVIASDLDGDGQLDLVFTHTNYPAALLKNTTATKGSTVRLHLIGTRCNRDAIGARAVLQTSGGKYLRQVFGGGSYLSQGPYEMHWGVPENEQPVSVDIVWPDGSKQLMTDLVAGEHYTVIQE